MVLIGLLCVALQADTALRAPAGGQFLLPLGSLFVPGLGQYVQRAPRAGAVLSGVALVGVALHVSGDISGLSYRELPADGPGRRGYAGGQLFQTAGELSAYDSFRRTARALRTTGRYEFLTEHEPVGRLLTAPFDPAFLSRWTTWVGLAFTGTVALVAASDGDGSHALTRGDVAFGTSVSLNAGIGEEAAFRGWLLPMMYEAFGRRLWIANATQSAIFGALHFDTKEFAFAIAGWAFYQGWLTRRNGWSVRESIFQHVWHDVVLILMEFADGRQLTLSLRLPLR